LSPTETYLVMSETLAPSASSPTPIEATIDKLLLTDNLDELRHRICRDYLRLLAVEYDDVERDRMLADFTTIDLVLETIEKERK
jgi:hypothetical protein